MSAINFNGTDDFVAMPKDVTVIDRLQQCGCDGDDPGPDNLVELPE